MLWFWVLCGLSPTIPTHTLPLWKILKMSFVISELSIMPLTDLTTVFSARWTSCLVWHMARRVHTAHSTHLRQRVNGQMGKSAITFWWCPQVGICICRSRCVRPYTAVPFLVSSSLKWRDLCQCRSIPSCHSPSRLHILFVHCDTWQLGWVCQSDAYSIPSHYVLGLRFMCARRCNPLNSQAICFKSCFNYKLPHWTTSRSSYLIHWAYKMTTRNYLHWSYHFSNVYLPECVVFLSYLVHIPMLFRFAIWEAWKYPPLCWPWAMILVFAPWKSRTDGV